MTNMGLSEISDSINSIRCGAFTDAKNNDAIKISGGPVTVRSAVFAAPRYNTSTTIRCNFSADIVYAGQDTFTLRAYDIESRTASASTTLAGNYLIIPMD